MTYACPLAEARRSHTILIVDDDDEVRELLLEFLRAELPECAVAGAANGEEALAILATLDRPPCQILLDIMMPVMDGRAFLDAIREDDALAAIPVTVVSAADTVVRNATHRLRKPFSLDTVHDLAVRYCAGLSRKEKAARPEDGRGQEILTEHRDHHGPDARGRRQADQHQHDRAGPRRAPS